MCITPHCDKDSVWADGSLTKATEKKFKKDDVKWYACQLTNG